MTGRRIHDTRTEQRHRWLAQLTSHPGSMRPNRVGFDCMALGWTRWFGPINGEVRQGEELTDAGRATLAEWDQSYGRPKP